MRNSTTTWILRLLAAIFLTSHSSIALSGDLTISIYRMFSNSKCTSGYLSIYGQIQGYALEKAWKENAPKISAIPAGIYSGYLRYDHKDHWRIELKNVLNRNHIQIHIGNSTNDSEGCILVGERIEKDLCAISPGTSHKTYRKLKNAFYGSENPHFTPNKQIVIEIVDGGGLKSDGVYRELLTH